MESNKNNNALDIAYKYRSQIAPRKTLSRHCPRNAITNRSSVHALYTNKSFVLGKPIELHKSKNSNVVNVSDNRLKEKRELIGLNDKFASLIERVRFLEAHNKKLQLQLDPLLKPEYKRSEEITQMFESEVGELKDLTYLATKDKGTCDLKSNQLKFKADKFKKRLADSLETHDENVSKITKLCENIADNDAEISLLKRRLEDIDIQINHYRINVEHIKSEIEHFKIELDTEVVLQKNLEKENVSLQDELTFMAQTHELELNEAKNKIFKDVGLDAGQFFKSEITKFIQELRNEYEETCIKQQDNIEHWYRAKLQDMQRAQDQKNDLLVGPNLLIKNLKVSIDDQNLENASLKANQAEFIARIEDLSDLIDREKQETNKANEMKDSEFDALFEQKTSILNDYGELINIKSNLEAEIEIYRSLLHNEIDNMKQVNNVFDYNFEEESREKDSLKVLGSREHTENDGSVTVTVNVGKGSEISKTIVKNQT